MQGLIELTPAGSGSRMRASFRVALAAGFTSEASVRTRSITAAVAVREPRGPARFKGTATRLALTLLLAGCQPGIEAANRVPAADQSSAATIVRAIANDLLTVAQLPGLSIAVSHHGERVFAEGFGYADIEARRPVTTGTRFRAASVSKVITATGMARLIQDGRLDLDTPIQTYVPAFPAKAWPITARQLAGHLSGLPHYSAADRIEPRFYPTLADALGVFSHVEVLSEPGTAYSYSTHGFTLLSAVVEGAAGLPFLEFMKTAVFDPLRMSATGPDLRTGSVDMKAALYQFTTGVLAPVANPEDPSYKWGGGGMVTTPSDLLRLTGAYMGGMLRPDVVALMFTGQRLRSGTETGVGIAWRNSWDMDGRRVIEHAGSMEGARSVISLFPDDSLALSIMTNRMWNSAIEETAHLLALPFLTEPAPVAQPSGTATGTVTLRNARGQETQLDGTLTLSAGRGELIIGVGTANAIPCRLVYLERGNRFALIRPDGVLHMTLEFVDGRVMGRATGYGSPQLRPPAESQPALVFEAAFREAGA